MIEATITEIVGWQRKEFKGLIGCRVSLISMHKRRNAKDLFEVHVGGIVRARKNSRIRRGRYAGIFLAEVELADVVVDDFEED